MDQKPQKKTMTTITQDAYESMLQGSKKKSESVSNYKNNQKLESDNTSNQNKNTQNKSDSNKTILSSEAVAQFTGASIPTRLLNTDEKDDDSDAISADFEFDDHVSELESTDYNNKNQDNEEIHNKSEEISVNNNINDESEDNSTGLRIIESRNHIRSNSNSSLILESVIEHNRDNDILSEPDDLLTNTEDEHIAEETPALSETENFKIHLLRNIEQTPFFSAKSELGKIRSRINPKENIYEDENESEWSNDNVNINGTSNKDYATQSDSFISEDRHYASDYSQDISASKVSEMRMNKLTESFKNNSLQDEISNNIFDAVSVNNDDLNYIKNVPFREPGSSADVSNNVSPGPSRNKLYMNDTDISRRTSIYTEQEDESIEGDFEFNEAVDPSKVFRPESLNKFKSSSVSPSTDIENRLQSLNLSYVLEGNEDEISEENHSDNDILENISENNSSNNDKNNLNGNLLNFHNESEFLTQNSFDRDTLDNGIPSKLLNDGRFMSPPNVNNELTDGEEKSIDLEFSDSDIPPPTDVYEEEYTEDSNDNNNSETLNIVAHNSSDDDNIIHDFDINGDILNDENSEENIEIQFSEADDIDHRNFNDVGDTEEESYEEHRASSSNNIPISNTSNDDIIIDDFESENQNSDVSNKNIITPASSKYDQNSDFSENSLDIAVIQQELLDSAGELDFLQPLSDELSKLTSPNSRFFETLTEHIISERGRVARGSHSSASNNLVRIGEFDNSGINIDDLINDEILSNHGIDTLDRDTLGDIEQYFKFGINPNELLNAIEEDSIEEIYANELNDEENHDIEKDKDTESEKEEEENDLISVGHENNPLDINISESEPDSFSTDNIPTHDSTTASISKFLTNQSEVEWHNQNSISFDTSKIFSETAVDGYYSSNITQLDGSNHQIPGINKKPIVKEFHRPKRNVQNADVNSSVENIDVSSILTRDRTSSRLSKLNASRQSTPVKQVTSFDEEILTGNTLSIVPFDESEDVQSEDHSEEEFDHETQISNGVWQPPSSDYKSPNHVSPVTRWDNVVSSLKHGKSEKSYKPIQNIFTTDSRESSEINIPVVNISHSKLKDKSKSFTPKNIESEKKVQFLENKIRVLLDSRNEYVSAIDELKSELQELKEQNRKFDEYIKQSINSSPISIEKSHISPSIAPAATFTRRTPSPTMRNPVIEISPRKKFSQNLWETKMDEIRNRIQARAEERYNEYLKGYDLRYNIQEHNHSNSKHAVSTYLMNDFNHNLEKIPYESITPIQNPGKHSYSRTPASVKAPNSVFSKRLDDIRNEIADLKVSIKDLMDTESVNYGLIRGSRRSLASERVNKVIKTAIGSRHRRSSPSPKPITKNLSLKGHPPSHKERKYIQLDEIDALRKDILKLQLSKITRKQY